MAPPVLIANPRSDAAFAELANARAANGAQTPGALERELRTHYPKAVVRERSLSSEAVVTWYVYRDGTWTATQG